MKKKYIRGILTVAVVFIMMSGLVACQLPDFNGNSQSEEEMSSIDVISGGVENSEDSTQGENVNFTMENSEDVDSGSSVTFEYIYGDPYEQATITGMKEDGTVAWTYVSDKYELAPVDQVEEIGIYNNMYYFVEDANIIALDLNTGEKIWENDELGGYDVSFCFDEQGTLYICANTGVDLMMIDKDGNTLERIEHLDNYVHCWPGKIACEDGYVYITYEFNGECDMQKMPMEWWNDMTWRGYTLNYCLSDGSIGQEHNKMEQEPVYNGRYYIDALGDNAQKSLQIDYLGEDRYRLNMCLDGSKCLGGIIGQLTDDKIEFRVTYDDGYFYAVYAGIVVQTSEGVVLKITESTDETIPAGSEFSFNIRSEITVSGQ